MNMEREQLNKEYGESVTKLIKDNKSKKMSDLNIIEASLKLLLENVELLMEVQLERDDYTMPHKGLRKANGCIDIHKEMKTNIGLMMPVFRELGAEYKKDKRRFTDIIKLKGEEGE